MRAYPAEGIVSALEPLNPQQCIGMHLRAPAEHAWVCPAQNKRIMLLNLPKILLNINAFIIHIEQICLCNRTDKLE